MQEIGEAAEKGELNGLVLMVIWNSPDLARRDVTWSFVVSHFCVASLLLMQCCCSVIFCKPLFFFQCANVNSCNH